MVKGGRLGTRGEVGYQDQDRILRLIDRDDESTQWRCPMGLNVRCQMCLEHEVVAKGVKDVS